MSEKMTDWFPPHIKPCTNRPGVYQVQMKFYGARSYSHWNGKTWGWACLTPHSAAATDTDSPDQNKRWRGFTEPQE